MPSYSDSLSPVKRPVAMARTSSQQSVSRGSPSNATMSNKPKQHKAHIGRAHTRTPSYGKNLHKLTKLTGTDEEDKARAHRKSQTPSTSPSASTQVKRNSSTISLPRVGSKVSIKKNKSDIQIKRDASSTKVNRSRPTTPIRKNESHGSGLDRLKRKTTAQFMVEVDDDGENQEDEWTEESGSPNLTRQSSVSKVLRNSLPPQEPFINGNTRLPDSPPESPSTEQPKYADARQTAQIQLQNRHQPQMNSALLTSRLLSGQTAVGELSSVSVNGSHTPPIHEPSSTPYPNNGISRFLNATHSSGGTTAVSHQFFDPTGATPLTRSPSPNPPSADPSDLRRAASAGNLSSVGKRTPVITKDPSPADPRLPESYTFAPSTTGRPGANLQAKLDLWKNMTTVEPPDGPPAPLRNMAPVGFLGTDERRIRLWEGAEREMSALGRFKDPILNRTKRTEKRWKEEKRIDVIGSNAQSSGLNSGYGHNSSYGRDHPSLESRVSTSTSSGTAESSGGSGVSRRQAAVDDRPISRAGPRSVRFEVGFDDGREQDQSEAVEELLRRIWTGGEAEAGDA